MWFLMLVLVLLPAVLASALGMWAVALALRVAQVRFRRVLAVAAAGVAAEMALTFLGGFTGFLLADLAAVVILVWLVHAYLAATWSQAAIIGIGGTAVAWALGLLAGRAGLLG
jgi:hypothetical protein